MVIVKGILTVSAQLWRKHRSDSKALFYKIFVFFDDACHNFAFCGILYMRPLIKRPKMRKEAGHIIDIYLSGDCTLWLGFYSNKTEAAHWDSTNESGEFVAIALCSIQAGGGALDTRCAS